MSAPRSKRYAASVLRPSAREVRRIDTGSNQALSSRTRVVPSVTSVSAPPMTPAIPIARRVSAMTSIESSSTRSWPSSVVNRSPAQARAGQRRQLPRHSEDGETIRTVRCGLDVEDMIVEAKMRDEVRAERRVAVEDEDPRLVLQADSQLALRAQHPLGFHPSDRRGPDAAVSREDGARRGEGGAHADL